ncbi:PIF1-like helicase-domain-containing protein [Parasitella parasitica]|nr:PIF1-like helicase-domain-containing protein [Parasitella parasitica]
MKRNQPKTKQENTLFSYFSSTKPPAKKEPLSSLLDRTSSSTANTANTANIANIANTVKQTIDLTEDDQVMIISSQDAVIDLESSQSSFQASSQGSMSRLNTAEMVNCSKYNRKGWSVEAKQKGPQKSSQDTRLSQEKKPNSQFERLQLNRPRITAKPSYEWLGPNDVKPYSSNFNPFVSASAQLKDEAPHISSQFERSFSASLGKRSYSDYDGSSSPSYESGSTGWGNNTNSKGSNRRVLPGPARPKDTNWSKSKAKPGYTRQARARVSYDKPEVLNRPIVSSTEYVPELSQEQKRVFNLVVRERKSLFFTGSAGTGKSVLLRAIIDKLRSEYGSRVAVTASTGIAACNINGCTLHSFGGIGLGSEKADELAAKVEYSRKASERWRETQVLIIDETFVRILNEMRLGLLSAEAVRIFKSLSRIPVVDGEFEPTELYPLRHEVDGSNKRRLTELRGDEIEFKAIDEGDPRKMQQCIAPAVLQLKLHAQVMLLKNLDAELVNGSIGVIVGFVGRGEYKNKDVCEKLRTPQRKRDRHSLFADRDVDPDIDMSVPWPVVKFANGKELVVERESWSAALPVMETGHPKPDTDSIVIVLNVWGTHHMRES